MSYGPQNSQKDHYSYTATTVKDYYFSNMAFAVFSMVVAMVFAGWSGSHAIDYFQLKQFGKRASYELRQPDPHPRLRVSYIAPSGTMHVKLMLLSSAAWDALEGEKDDYILYNPKVPSQFQLASLLETFRFDFLISLVAIGWIALMLPFVLYQWFALNKHKLNAHRR